MVSTIKMVASHQPDHKLVSPEIPESRAELVSGLMGTQTQISPKYFYNTLGSKLFEAICELEEYYLTRTEARIFEASIDEICAQTGTNVTFIDLGAGNCAKAAKLFGVMHPIQYVPIDISATFLAKAAASLQAEHPDIPIYPVAMDFAEGLHLPAQVYQQRRLFFYPGSSLGNFTPPQALQFLRRIRLACTGPEDALLIGIDLVKDAGRLEAAYDDALGVTAAFNRNILLHVNSILGTNFKLNSWRHRAIFNPAQGRIEMHLQAVHDTTLQWDSGSRHFSSGDYIHTENSYKYTKRHFLELLGLSGFGKPKCWTDPQNSFLVCYANAT